MRKRVLVVIWLAAMIGAGFAIGTFEEQLLTWDADRTLVHSLNIHPEVLPVFTVDQAEVVAATGLQFQEVQNSGVTFSYETDPLTNIIWRNSGWRGWSVGL